MPESLITFICTLCKFPKPISEFYKNSRHSIGHTYWCRDCFKRSTRFQGRRYYQENKSKKLERAKLPHVIERRKEFQKIYREKNAHKRLANDAVKWAVKTGKLIKPKNCHYCGSDKRIQAHHYLGYERKNRLEVLWLCHKCHAFTHRLP